MCSNDQKWDRSRIGLKCSQANESTYSRQIISSGKLKKDLYSLKKVEKNTPMIVYKATNAKKWVAW